MFRKRKFQQNQIWKQNSPSEPIKSRRIHEIQAGNTKKPDRETVQLPEINTDLLNFLQPSENSENLENQPIKKKRGRPGKK